MMFRFVMAAAMAMALAPWATPVRAQPTAPSANAASAPASSPPSASPDRRVLTPTEKRESSSMPGELRPEDKVLPQIVVPLRKPSAVPAAPAARTKSTPGGIDDTAARCEAQATRAARERCRSQAGATTK